MKSSVGLFSLIVAVCLLGTLPDAHSQTGAPFSKPCTVAQKSADDLKDGDIEKLDQCLKAKLPSAQSVSTFEKRVLALGERSNLIAKQTKAVEEATNLRKQAIALAKAIASLSITKTELGVHALEPLKKSFNDLELKSQELRTTWSNRMKFDSSSPAYSLLELLKDPNLSTESRNSIKAFQSSFPKAYWGEAEDASQPLASLDQSLDSVRSVFKSQAVKLGAIVAGETSAAAVRGFSETSNFQAAGKFEELFVSRIRAQELERAYGLQISGGITITTQDRIAELIRKLDSGITNAPQAIKKQVAIKLNARKKRLATLQAKALAEEKLAGTPLRLVQNIKMLNSSMAKSIVACSRQSKTLGTWYSEVSGQIDEIEKSSVDPQGKPALRAHRILNEEALVQLLEIRGLCSEKARL